MILPLQLLHQINLNTFLIQGPIVYCSLRKLQLFFRDFYGTRNYSVDKNSENIKVAGVFLLLLLKSCNAALHNFCYYSTEILVLILNISAVTVDTKLNLSIRRN